MANYSRWDDAKNKRRAPSAATRAGVEHDLALGQLIHDLRTGAGLSQRELAERMGTTQSVISRLEEGGGARNRIDRLARVAEALGRHLIISFPRRSPPSSRARSRSLDGGRRPHARNGASQSGQPGRVEHGDARLAATVLLPETR